MDFVLSKWRNRSGERGNPLENVQQAIAEDTEEEEEARHLAFKSGFISLKDRINSFADRSRLKDQDASRYKLFKQTKTQSAPQFATLQELFANRAGTKNTALHSQDSHHRGKKTKVPIMKLSKEDWNVKCWEERVGKRHVQPSSDNKSTCRLRKPERQIEVFQGRIEDVASKLDKVREGMPLDEELHKLALNKVGQNKSSHEWTDLLKRELEKGTHNPRQLKSSVTLLASDRSDNSSLKNPYRSPLGRPIRKIFEDEDDDDQKGASEKKMVIGNAV